MVAMKRWNMSQNKENLRVCLRCPNYSKELELIYGVSVGNCDIDDYLDCDKIGDVVDED